MQFGLYAPVPHVSVGSPEITKSVAGGLSALPGGIQDPAWDLAREVLLQADASGYDIILFAERHLGADMEAWILGSAISSLTQRIKSMIAVHPGLWHPQIVAKMFASLDRLTKGRTAMNLITGWNVEEHTMFGGDTMLHNDDRYIRAEEFMDVLQGMWAHSPFSYKGRFYTVDNAQLLLRPAHPLEIFAASRSPRGLDMIARVADWWFVDYDKEAANTEEVMQSLERAMTNVRTRAEKLGRKVRFAYNPFVCFGDNEDDARKRAQNLVRVDGDDADTRKMLNRIGPSMKSGCVGHPDEVRAQVERFHDMGIELLLFKFVPNVEETRAIADELIAPWRAKHGEPTSQAAE